MPVKDVSLFADTKVINKCQICSINRKHSYEFLSHDRWVRQRIPISLVYLFHGLCVHESRASLCAVVLHEVTPLTMQEWDGNTRIMVAIIYYFASLLATM